MEGRWGQPLGSGMGDPAQPSSGRRGRAMAGNSGATATAAFPWQPPVSSPSTPRARWPIRCWNGRSAPSWHPARYGHAHPTNAQLSGARGGIIQKFGFGRTRWSTPVFRTAVRFRSAPFSPLPPCREPIQGLQWFRRGARRMTEACSVRANP